MVQITPYHLFYNKTLKIDTKSVIKIDMSHFEFIFSFKKILKTQIWTQSLCHANTNDTKLFSGKISAPEWIENLAASAIREVFSGVGWVEELYGLGRQELELQGENAAFSDLGYRIEAQTFYYRDSNLSILHVWTPLTK